MTLCGIASVVGVQVPRSSEVASKTFRKVVVKVVMYEEKVFYGD